MLPLTSELHAQVRQRLGDIAAVVVSSTPDELAVLLKSDMALWGPIIKAAGWANSGREQVQFAERLL